MLVTVCIFSAKSCDKTKFLPFLLLAFIVFITKTGRVTSLAPTISANEEDLVGKALSKYSRADLSNVDFLQGNRSPKTLNGCKNDDEDCAIGEVNFWGDPVPNCCGECKLEVGENDFVSERGRCAGCIKVGKECDDTYGGCCRYLYCKDSGNSEPRKTCENCILDGNPCKPEDHGCCERHFCHSTTKLCKKCVEIEQQCSPNDICCNGNHCDQGKCPIY